eukprot:jgi/Botrbrau1/2317/Bobra.39_1s0006.1
MDFRSDQLEEKFDRWEARRWRCWDMLSSVACFIILAVATPKIWPSRGAIAHALAILSVGATIACAYQGRKKYLKYRRTLFAFNRVCGGLIELFVYQRLQRKLREGTDKAIIDGVLLCKWPIMAFTMFFYWQKASWLPITGFPTLLLYHAASFLAAGFTAPAAHKVAFLLAASERTNGVLHSLSAVVPFLSACRGNGNTVMGVSALVPVGERTCVGSSPDHPLRFEQVLLLYWLVMQAVPFWLLVWQCACYEAKARAQFVDEMELRKNPPPQFVWFGESVVKLLAVHVVIIGFFVWQVPYLVEEAQINMCGSQPC